MSSELSCTNSKNNLEQTRYIFLLKLEALPTIYIARLARQNKDFHH